MPHAIRLAAMPYTVRIFSAEDIPDADRTAAAQRFCKALDETLGAADLVAPVYQAYLRLLQVHGEQARPWDLTPSEQILADQWEAAEAAALAAAFGTDRYMDDAQYELRF